MAHQRCLVHSSPARALRRVFVTDRAAAPSLARHAPFYLFPPRLFSSASRSIPSKLTLPRTPGATQHVRPFGTTPALRAFGYKKRLANEKIPYTWVRIASSLNALSPPQRAAQVLSSMDLKTHSLVMVAPPSHDAGAEGYASEEAALEARCAICRIYENAEVKAAEAEAAREARRRLVDRKELEISWSIAANDLRTKLRSLAKFLKKGLKVELILAKKKNGRLATDAEADAVLDAVRQHVAAIPGAKEYRKMEGEPNRLARMYFDGKFARKKKGKDGEPEPEEEGEGQEGEGQEGEGQEGQEGQEQVQQEETSALR
ncbi:hypothetical protein F4804DRAFT_200051 [Jackrogersella minutella]|nr:hypothetical protein F4804DRAFT_200051 [Jackrogersella minutella]